MPDPVQPAARRAPLLPELPPAAPLVPPAALTALLVASMGALLALDLQLERGVVSGIPYVLVVALAAALPRAWAVPLCAGAATLLTVLGYLGSPPSDADWKAVVNRAAVLVVLWGTAVVLLQRKRLLQRARGAAFVERLLEASPSAMLVVDAAGRIRLANAEAVALFGYPRRDLLGQPVEQLVPVPYRAGHPALRAAFVAAGASQRMGSGREVRALHQDGREFPVEIGLTPFPTADGTWVVTTLADLTARQQREAAAQTQLLARTHEAAEEGLRRRLARELHDALGQALTALKLDAAWLGQQLPPTAAALRGRTQAMEALAGETMTTVRQLAAELRPPLLEEYGLPDAVEWYLSEFAERTGISGRLTAPAPPPSWDLARATAVFRILQEALTNVARHAGATQVTVALHAADGGGVLEVADDGRGITEAEAAAPQALGLRGMQERAALYGGTCTIRGVAGAGTTVTVRMPAGTAPAPAAAGPRGRA